MKKYKKIIPPKTQPTHRDGRPVLFRIKNGVRKIIIKRDGLQCRYCYERLTYDTHTIDHVIPVSAGGTESPGNLVVCCGTCNKHAKNLVFPSFETKQIFLLAKKVEVIKSKEANFKHKTRK